MNKDDPEQTNSFSGNQDTCCSNESCCGPHAPVKRIAPKIGRNDPCPCDSGRKYKKCCGQYL